MMTDTEIRVMHPAERVLKLTAMTAMIQFIRAHRNYVIIRTMTAIPGQPMAQGRAGMVLPVTVLIQTCVKKVHMSAQAAHRSARTVQVIIWKYAMVRTTTVMAALTRDMTLITTLILYVTATVMTTTLQ